MDRELYRRMMLETSRKIGPIILEYLAPLRNEDEVLHNLCSELSRRKTGVFETRAYLLRTSFEVCSKRTWTKNIMHACAAVELELVSMYYTNRIFDDKGGKEIISQPKNQFIAAMITHDLASQALTKACSKVDYKTFKNIRNIFDAINRIFYIGQFNEVNLNLYNPNSELEFNRMLDLYFKRNYAVNNSFFERIATIGAILGGGTKEQIEALGTFGENYGMALQIINDIGDFVPPKFNAGTDEKLSEDSYSDILHGKLTLPIIYCLKKGAPEEKKLLVEALENNNVEINKLIEITRLLVNNGSIDFSKKTVLDFIKKARSSLKVFPKDKQTAILEMCFIAYCNRYYRTLSKFRT